MKAYFNFETAPIFNRLSTNKNSLTMARIVREYIVAYTLVYISPQSIVPFRF